MAVLFRTDDALWAKSIFLINAVVW